MKRFIIFICLIFIFMTSGCRDSGGTSLVEIPPLLEPEGVTYDTAIAVRDSISRIKQYRAGVRIYSKPLFFVETSLKFKCFYTRVGQKVAKGDILAELETEELTKEIKRQEKAIDHLKKTYAYENEMLLYDIEIANLELQNLSLSGADDTELELKRISVQKLTLALAHQQEAQALEIGQYNERLNETNAQLDTTYITAPFDGTVVYTEALYEGSAITPYKPVIYIADEDRIMIEYSGTDSFSYSLNMELTAQIGDELYELEYEPLSLEDRLAYMLDNRTAPATFYITDENADVEPGGFAAIYVSTDRRDGVIIIPVNAMYSGVDGNYVYVMVSGTKEIRLVETGIRNDSYIEIKNGLEEGDEVFVKQ